MELSEKIVALRKLRLRPSGPPAPLLCPGGAVAAPVSPSLPSLKIMVDKPERSGYNNKVPFGAYADVLELVDWLA